MSQQERIQWGNESSLVNYTAEHLKERHLKPPLPGKNFVGSHLERKLYGLQPGQVLLDPVLFGDIRVDDPTLRANGYGVPGMAAGREENKSHVLFGQLHLEGDSQGERVELVAMKPTSPRAAAREHHAAQRVGELFQDDLRRPATFTTLGFFRDGLSGRTNLITRYEHSVVTADRLLWNREVPASRGQVIDTLGKAAVTLGMLHTNGLVHGDPQPKNIATDNAGVRFVDLEETADLADARGEIEPFAAHRKVAADLALFLLRLNGDYRALVGEHFAEPYVAYVNRTETLPEHARPTIDEVLAIADKPQEDIPYIGR